jgi:P-aminobenzoate N-oxygenase AurF
MNTTLSLDDQTLIERLIRISKEKPLMPESFVPWQTDFVDGQIYLPESLVSLAGLPIYDTLTLWQKQELARHEVVQAMYSYCWSEGLFCVFMNRYILNRDPQDIERQFLIRELIEEYRHQEMFAQTIEKLKGEPLKVGWIQRSLGGFTAKFMPDSVLFLSCIAIEMMADQYGEAIRKHTDSYPVLRKVSQLHNIEEARHILYTQAVLKRYTEGVGFVGSTFFSLLVLGNMRFFQSIYVRSEIYERIGLHNPKSIKRQAFGHYQAKFAHECLGSVKELVNGFNGFNWFTRPIWRWVLKINIEK